MLNLDINVKNVSKYLLTEIHTQIIFHHTKGKQLVDIVEKNFQAHQI